MINLAATEHTPCVIFEPTERNLYIKGRCVPENARGFFEPLIGAIGLLMESDPGAFTFDISLEYFNTSSAKSLLDLFKVAEKNAGNHGVTVRWRYAQGDEDLRESGEDYASIVDFSFELIEE